MLRSSKERINMHYGYLEEGDKCPEKDCKGRLEYPHPKNCSCHISPPCHACPSVVLTCNECGWEDNSEDEKYISTEYEGLFERIIKPQPLDNTKVSYRCEGHTNSSMIKKGVYPEHMSMEDVRKEVDGTFGGRFEYFKDGKFKFIAYTD